jgi:class 3 adenylate cyclase
VARRDRDRDTRLGDMLADRIYRQMERAIAGSDLPEGTVTVVFTDVEGSTGLVRTLGDARARVLLRRHDELVRAALHEGGGEEVEHPGDSFMAAFRTATGAVACALDIHGRIDAEREARPETPRVRIGMDTGEVIREDEGYFGATVFRAARIADAADGGEVLVSQVVRLLAAGAPVDFVDAGERELRGLAGRHPLFRVVGRGGRS